MDSLLHKMEKKGVGPSDRTSPSLEERTDTVVGESHPSYPDSNTRSISRLRNGDAGSISDAANTSPLLSKDSPPTYRVTPSRPYHYQYRQQIPLNHSMNPASVSVPQSSLQIGEANNSLLFPTIVDGYTHSHDTRRSFSYSTTFPDDPLKFRDAVAQDMHLTSPFTQRSSFSGNYNPNASYSLSATRGNAKIDRVASTSANSPRATQSATAPVPRMSFSTEISTGNMSPFSGNPNVIPATGIPAEVPTISPVLTRDFDTRTRGVSVHRDRVFPSSEHERDMNDTRRECTIPDVQAVNQGQPPREQHISKIQSLLLHDNPPHAAISQLTTENRELSTIITVASTVDEDHEAETEVDETGTESEVNGSDSPESNPLMGISRNSEASSSPARVTDNAGKPDYSGFSFSAVEIIEPRDVVISDAHSVNHVDNNEHLTSNRSGRHNRRNLESGTQSEQRNLLECADSEDSDDSEEARMQESEIRVEVLRMETSDSDSNESNTVDNNIDNQDSNNDNRSTSSPLSSASATPSSPVMSANVSPSDWESYVSSLSTLSSSLTCPSPHSIGKFLFSLLSGIFIGTFASFFAFYFMHSSRVRPTVKLGLLLGVILRVFLRTTMIEKGGLHPYTGDDHILAPGASDAHSGIGNGSISNGTIGSDEDPGATHPNGGKKMLERLKGEKAERRLEFPRTKLARFGMKVPLM